MCHGWCNCFWGWDLNVTHGNAGSIQPRSCRITWNPSELVAGNYQLCEGFDCEGSILVSDMTSETEFEVVGGNSDKYFTIQMTIDNTDSEIDNTVNEPINYEDTPGEANVLPEETDIQNDNADEAEGDEIVERSDDSSGIIAENVFEDDKRNDEKETAVDDISGTKQEDSGIDPVVPESDQPNENFSEEPEINVTNVTIIPDETNQTTEEPDDDSDGGCFIKALMK